MVLTTVVGVGPAAFDKVFSEATADGSIATQNARVIATKDLTPFMVHLISYVGI
jgi:hypothetical protein